MGQDGKQLRCGSPDRPVPIVLEHDGGEGRQHRDVDYQDAGFAVLPELCALFDQEVREYRTRNDGCGDDLCRSIAADEGITTSRYHEETEHERDHHGIDS